MSAAARRRSEKLGQSKAGGGRLPSPSTSAGLVSKCPPDLSRCAASTPRRTTGVQMERAKGAMDAGAEAKFCTAGPSEPRAVLARGAAAQAVALASRARAVFPAQTDTGATASGARRTNGYCGRTRLLSTMQRVMLLCCNLLEARIAAVRGSSWRAAYRRGAARDPAGRRILNRHERLEMAVPV